MSDQPDQFDESQYEERPESKRGCGCFFWGCLIVVLICLALAIAIGVSGYYWYKGMIDQYTAEEPIAIEVVELAEEEQAALNARFEEFGEAVEAGEASGQIELTAQEINALISQNEDLAGKAFVRIEDGQIGGDVSIPVDFLPGGSGRYFNATAEFDVSMQGGVLLVTLADATVNGSALPAEFIQGMQSQNLAKEVYEDPDAARALQQFESLEIVGDKVILKARSNAASDEAQATNEEAAVQPEAPAEPPEPPIAPATPPEGGASLGPQTLTIAA